MREKNQERMCHFFRQNRLDNLQFSIHARVKTFDANSYRSAEENDVEEEDDEEDEDQDTDVEGSFASDAELFGEGTESADDVTLTGSHEDEAMEMDAVTAAGNKLNAEIRKFLTEGGAGGGVGGGLSAVANPGEVAITAHAASVNPSTTASYPSLARSVKNGDDALAFDDETVWDQNSGGFSFADFTDDSCLEAVKNVSSSTPSKTKLDHIVGDRKVAASTASASGAGESVGDARHIWDAETGSASENHTKLGNLRNENLAHITSDVLSGLFPKPPDLAPATREREGVFAAVQESQIISEFAGVNADGKGLLGTGSEEVDAGNNNNNNNNPHSDNHHNVIEGELSSVVKVKLMELEREIEEFKSQNDCLAKLRRDKEEAVVSLKRELAEFQREKSEEMERMEEHKESETKRLKKDRKAFEEMQRIAKEKNERRESEEIKCLNAQIEDLQVSWRLSERERER